MIVAKSHDRPVGGSSTASDFMSFAMKGAANVRLFGHAPTAGAFSTYYELAHWGGILVRFASGDSISRDGEALIGHGMVPDEIVLLKQSDLLAGKDTIHDAAVAWLQTELKP
jgi:C-terminal processing protease CtpA/Prc